MTSPNPTNPSDLSLGVLLRCAADGELTPEQVSRLREHLREHPDDEARIEFERRLRRACGCCAPECCAPSGVRARVETACSVGVWRLARARRLVVRFGALAALIAMVGVLGVIWARRDAGSAWNAPYAAGLADFARREHKRCDDPGSRAPKFTIERAEAVPAEFAKLAGHPVSLCDLMAAEEGGLVFVDAGHCDLPGKGGLHVRLRERGEGGGDDGGLVSLWIQPDDGRLTLEEGVVYNMGKGCECVRIWRVGEVRYTLVCGEKASPNLAVTALRVPDRVRTP